MAVKPTLGNTLGAVFLGIIGCAFLFGAIAVQVFTYYSHFPNDWRSQKIAVGVLTGLVVVHFAFATYNIYSHVIAHWGKTAIETSISWTFRVQIILDNVIVLAVQGLYAWRVQTLGKHFSRVWPWIVVGITGFGWVVGIIMLIASSVTSKINGTRQLRKFALGALVLPVTIDIVIAGTLCYCLKKSHSAFTATNNKLLRIMRYAIVCGFITSACSLVSLICIATLPNTYVFVGINLMLPRLYVFSYMAMLNARKTMPGKDDSPSFSPSGVLQNFRNSAWVSDTEGRPTATMGTQISTDQDSIPSSSSKYDDGEKGSQQASLQHKNADIGV